MSYSEYATLAEGADQDGIQRIVVGAIIPAEGRVLLLERPTHDFMGGIFELPSGRVEERETLEGALRREVLEETGLAIERVISHIDYFDYPSKNGRMTRQLNFLVDVASSEKISLKEHSSFVWAHRVELKRYPVTEQVRALLNLYWAGQPGHEASPS